MSASTQLAAQVAILADRYDKAMALIRDLAEAVPKDADSGGYGQTAAQMVLRCRVFVGLEPGTLDE